MSAPGSEHLAYLAARMRRHDVIDSRDLREAIADLADIVAGLLPADEATPVEPEWPVKFIDRDGDNITVDPGPGPNTVGICINRLGDAAAFIEANDVDRFIAAVRAAAGR